jgi:hypothetical protein
MANMKRITGEFPGEVLRHEDMRTAAGITSDTQNRHSPENSEGRSSKIIAAMSL